ncbi:hypothetical protein HDU78_004646 [Chytriomyces hyalinus]|nr:hypothetical protein HDU78_004646 [Chytriomyces hyalinus]KAJ3266026.1 hypothetical protein HDU77_002818 [Chytriomyces hyalinus]
MLVEVSNDFGYVIAVMIAFYLQQNFAFVIQVLRQRMATGIKAPSFYPRDSEIKELKLSKEQVQNYMYAQRIHQNNMEFMSFFLPVFLVAGVSNPIHTAAAGAFIFVCRMIYGFVPPKSSIRALSGFFHLGEWYVLYLAGSFAYNAIYAKAL